MATAIKEFAEDWIEAPSPEDSWTRQSSVEAEPTTSRDEFLFIIKRPASEKQSSPRLGHDRGLWKRQLLRDYLVLPANRDDPNYDAIEAQIQELRQHADEEGEEFSSESATAALRFCHDLAADHEPAIFLMANGNLRAVWQNKLRDQIGIQFMPNGLLQYVILRDRDGATLKALGEDVSYSKVRYTVEVQELMGLWFCGQG